MITLTTGQVLATDPDWAVATGGDYAADALVECYRVSDSEQRVAFYAQFIADGTYP